MLLRDNDPGECINVQCFNTRAGNSKYCKIHIKKNPVRLNNLETPTDRRMFEEYKMTFMGGVK